MEVDDFFIDAKQFKEEFEKAQEHNKSLASGSSEAGVEASLEKLSVKEEKKETTEEKKE